MTRFIRWLLVIAAVAVAGWLVARVIGSAPLVAKPTTVDWYMEKASQWERHARLLRASQVLLAALAITASVLSAARWRPKWLSEGLAALIAAVSIALLTSLDLTVQANKLRNAWRCMTVEILEYNQPGAVGSLDSLRAAYDEAEKIVGDYSPRVNP